MIVTLIERVSRHLQRYFFELFLNYSATRKPHKTPEKVDGERFKMPLRRPTLYPIELPRLLKGNDNLMLVADRSVNNPSTVFGMITVFAKTSMERLIDFLLIPSGYLVE